MILPAIDHTRHPDSRLRDNGMVFVARQIFFPKTSAWDNLRKSLKARFGTSIREHLAGPTSEPFALGTHRRDAIKVIDELGNEVMVVREATA